MPDRKVTVRLEVVVDQRHPEFCSATCQCMMIQGGFVGAFCCAFDRALESANAPRLYPVKRCQPCLSAEEGAKRDE